MISLVLQLLRARRWFVPAAAVCAVAFGAIENLREQHVKGQLVAARSALRNPQSGRLWRAEAMQSREALAECDRSRTSLAEALSRQNRALDAARDSSRR